ncbi:MAG: hypothetical protein NTV57_16015 [Cyanobacteria bacterium]|nr:hypothetical protein [Cyanobacteriota bacterium]
MVIEAMQHNDATDRLPPMPALLETLQLIHPAMAAGAAAEFRSALVAILQQLDQDETAVNRSLQGWWQWLDEEGYDRDGFGLILNQVCEAKLGVQGGAELRGFLQSSADEPEGLPKLMEHVQTNHAALAKEIETLETLAVTEEQQLQATAGGSSAGKDVAISLGVVTGTAATIYVGYKAVNGVRWLANKWRNRNQGALERDIDRDEVRGTERLEREAGDLERQARREEGPLLERAMKDPAELLKYTESMRRDVVLNKTSITEYTEQHIELRVEKLVGDHAVAFAETTIDKDIKDMIRSSPEYKERVFRIAANDPITAEASSDLSLDTKRAIRDAASAVENGEYDDFFENMQKEIWSSKGTEIRAKFTKELTSCYTKLVRDEVELAKKEAQEEMDNPMLKFINEGKATFKESKVIAKDDVLYRAREATALAEREAKAAVREAEETAEDVIKI